ncbi:MAG: FAD-dependent oxidoreductase [Candidatus Pacebacteria bacterium]|jgi:alkyl hydroperoxide reductase subunit F|nr:FAD-dependent oxidoreductase [Candidatus Paceibacterota bacterium]
MEDIYDLIIIGGGPAGAAAGVYAARKRVKTLMLAEVYAGQSTDSAEVQNWIGTIAISGPQLAASLKAHVEAYAADVLTMKEERVQKLEKQGDNFVVTTEKGSYTARTILVSTGSHRRKLEALGADKYEHKGLTYCASCDGPMFADQDLAVIGAGNAAFETAAQLLSYAKSVTIINRSPSFNRADAVTVEKVLSHPNMRAATNVEILEVKGEQFVNGIVIRDRITGETKELSVGGIFIEIGQLPNTGFLEGVVDLNESKNVVTDPRTQKTSVPGIWAAGDCTDVLYHQNNIAAGDAVRALEDIFQYLHSK